MPSHARLIFLLGLLLLFVFHRALSAPNQVIGLPEIISFNKTDYRGGTQNWNFVQSPEGILFVGNNKGVLEFDGVRWGRYDMPNGSIVKSLAVDKLNPTTLYVGAQGELGLLHRFPIGPARYESLTTLIPESQRGFADVWQIIATENDGVFFGAQGAMFHWKDSTFTIHHPKGRFENFFQVRGELYAQDTQAGLLWWNGQMLEAIPNGQDFAQTRIAAMLQHPDGILLATDFKGMFLLSNSGIRPWQMASSSFLLENHVYSALCLHDGRYAIGTVENGLLIMEADGTPVQHLSKISGLQNNTVLALFEDREHNLWLGLDNGIDYIKIRAPFTLIESDSGIEGTGYASILYNDTLYVGTNQGLYFLPWTKNNNPFRLRTFQRVAGTRGQVWSLQQLGGELLACLHEGVFRIEGNRALPVSNRKGAWKFMELAQHPGYALLGTYTGLELYQMKTESSGNSRWKHVGMLDEFSESSRVLEQDSKGFIWVSHAYKGLYRIQLNSEFQIAEVRFYNSADGLPCDLNIQAAKIWNEVVFNTPQGVYLYQPLTDRFISDSTFNKVFGPKPRMQHLTEDASGNIWFSVNDQFGVLNVSQSGLLKNPEAEPLYFDHLLEQLVDGFEHIYAVDSQHVLIGTESGFVQYHPSAGKNSTQIFQALIREITPNSEPGNRFSPKLRSLRFSFAAPYFEHLNKVQYRHQLQGFDDNWSAWDKRTEREFTSLPHGDYTFILQAKNAYGQLSEPDLYHFTILPPWYASFWAKSVYTILFIVVLLILLNIHQRRLKKLEKTQLVILAQKDQELQQTQQQSEATIERLASENMEKDLSHKNAQLASATMHLVQKGEILLKLKRDLSKLRDEVSPPNRKKVQTLIHTIDENIRLDEDWDQFALHFDQVHENFLQSLQQTYPELTPKDLKLCAYLRMNLSTKEIAPLLNISVRGVEVSRYRLRKKLNLDTDVNLVQFIMKL